MITTITHERGGVIVERHNYAPHPKIQARIEVLHRHHGPDGYTWHTLEDERIIRHGEDADAIHASYLAEHI